MQTIVLSLQIMSSDTKASPPRALNLESICLNVFIYQGNEIYLRKQYNKAISSLPLVMYQYWPNLLSKRHELMMYISNPKV